MHIIQPISLGKVGYIINILIFPAENNDIPSEEIPDTPSSFDDAYIAHLIDKLYAAIPEEISNAAAYLCHISYQNNEVKRKIW